MIYEIFVYGILVGGIVAFFWELHRFTKILTIILAIISMILLVGEMGRGNSSVLTIKYATEWYDYIAYFIGIFFGNSVGTGLAEATKK